MRKYQRSQTMQQRAVPLSQMWSVLLNWMLPCVTLVTGQWAVWVQLGCYPGTDGSRFCKLPVRSTAWITTVKVFPVSLVTWTLQGGQLTSFLGSTLWLRRPFFALGSWVTFSCGHYKSNSMLFLTPQNTSLLRRLAMDPRGRGGHLLCPSDISSFKTMWVALTEWFLWAERLKELMCWPSLDQGDGGFCELGLVLVCFSEHLTNVSSHNLLIPCQCVLTPAPLEHNWQVLTGALTCSLLVEEMLDSASSSPRSSFLDFQNLPSRRKRWCSSSSSQAFFQPILRLTCSRWTLTVMSCMFSEGIQALWTTLKRDS